MFYRPGNQCTHRGGDRKKHRVWESIQSNSPVHPCRTGPEFYTLRVMFEARSSHHESAGPEPFLFVRDLRLGRVLSGAPLAHCTGFSCFLCQL